MARPKRTRRTRNKKVQVAPTTPARSTPPAQTIIGLMRGPTIHEIPIQTLLGMGVVKPGLL